MHLEKELARERNSRPIRSGKQSIHWKAKYRLPVATPMPMLIVSALKYSRPVIPTS